MKHAICYISTASKELEDTEIKELLINWKKRNESLKIKGFLIFSAGHFFQVLEGDKEKILTLFEEIKSDSRHNSVIQVLGKDVTEGAQEGYQIDYLTEQHFSRPNLIQQYCESVKGMDRETQRQIKVVLESFIDTQVL